MNGRTDEHRRFLRAVIAQTRWLIRLFDVGANLGTVVGAGLLLVLAAGLLDLFAPLSVSLRWIAWIAACAGAAVAISRRIIRPMIAGQSDVAVARRIGARTADEQECTIAAVQFCSSGHAESKGAGAAVSDAFVARLLAEAVDKLRGFRPIDAVDVRRLKQAAGFACASLVVLLLATLPEPSRFRTSLARLSMPWREIAPDTGVRFEIAPGDAEVLLGDPVELRATTVRGNVRRLQFEIRDEQGRRFIDAGADAGGGRFMAAITAVRGPFEYRAVGGGTWSDFHRIRSVDRPRVVRQERSLRLPEYLDVETSLSIADDAVEAQAPEGSRLRWNVRTASPIRSARVVSLALKKSEIPNPNRRARRWFADRLPGDAVPEGEWRFRTTPRGRVHESPAGEFAMRGLSTDGNGFNVGKGEVIYVEGICPAKAPKSIAVEFKVAGAWGRLAVFGAPLPERSMRWGSTNLPGPDEWTRLEIPAEKLDLEDKTLQGVRFYAADGSWSVLEIGALEPATIVQEKLEVDREHAMSADATDPTNWSVEFPVEDDRRLRLELLDGNGYGNAAHPALTTRLLRDHPPVIRLERPEVDLTVAAPEPVPLLAIAIDDFGLAETRLAWSLETSPAMESGGLKTPQSRVERIWFADRLPLGAKTSGEWKWEAVDDVADAHFHAPSLNRGMHQFQDAVDQFRIYPGDHLFADVFLPHDARPREILLAFQTEAGWEHRSYWGVDLIALGRPGTASRRRVDDLPGLGEWRRIEVPAARLALEGKSIRGMAFYSWGGTFKTRKVGAISIRRWLDAESRTTSTLPADAVRHPLERFDNSPRRVQTSTDLHLERLPVRPGDVVLFAVEAVDRKGQVAQSRVCRVRIGSDGDSIDRQLERLLLSHRSALDKALQIQERQSEVGRELREFRDSNPPAKDRLEGLAEEQERIRKEMEALKAEIDALTRAAQRADWVPPNVPREMEAIGNGKVDAAAKQMQQQAEELKSAAKQAQEKGADRKNARSMEKAAERQQSIEDHLKSISAELERAGTSLEETAKDPSSALSRMRQALQRQAAERVEKELTDLREFSRTLAEAVGAEAEKRSGAAEVKQEAEAVAESLLDKAKQLLDLPDSLPRSADAPTRGNDSGERTNRPSPSKGSPRTPGQAEDRAGEFQPAVADRLPPEGAGNAAKNADPTVRRLRRAKQSLQADSQAVDALANQVGEARRQSPSAKKFGEMMAQPAMQKALAMAERMRMMQVESLTQAPGKAQTTSRAGKTKKATRVGPESTAENRGGSGLPADAADVLGNLDPALQQALMKLQPKLRDELLEGLKEQGPEAWRPMIRDYFERISRRESTAGEIVKQRNQPVATP